MSRITLITVSILAVILQSACATTPPPASTPVVITVASPTQLSPTALPPTAIPPTAVPPTAMPTTAPAIGMANPASVFCQQQGGKTDIRKDAKGGEVGYCVFPDKSECEEWAFQRGECKPGAKPSAAASSADPFTYCSTVGNIDTPDARYTGPKMPDAVVKGLIKAMKMPAGAPVDEFARLTKWRCMGGKVYACNIGANIPCDEKADTNRTPTAAMNEFCTANPTSSAIPAVVTGRATVYDWKCASGKPAIAKELTQPDARGFLAMFWYEIGK